MVARMSRPPSRSVGDSPEPATSQDYPSGLLININYRQEDRSMTTDEKTLGLLPKYTVTRNNDPVGKHDDCKFFVLDPTHDPLAIGALIHYAEAANAAGYEALHGDLLRLIQCPGDCPDDCLRCGSTFWEALCPDCRFYAAQDG
jgi:hypothetical protein